MSQDHLQPDQPRDDEDSLREASEYRSLWRRREKLEKDRERVQYWIDLVDAVGTLLLAAGLLVPLLGWGQVSRAWVLGIALTLILGSLGWQIRETRRHRQRIREVDDRLQAFVAPEPQVTITTEGCRSSRQEVRRTVLRPLEDCLKTSDGITTLIPQVHDDWVCLKVTFQPSIDLDQTVEVLEERLEQVLKEELPEDFEQITLRRFPPPSDGSNESVDILR